jgi:hypothetical protein
VRSVAFFDGSKGYLAIFDSNKGPVEFVTTNAQSGKAILIDDGATCRQLSELEWALERRHMGRDFARGCGARLYKIRDGYEGALERMRADADQA